jgi:surface polysaccharide O-acyltransferase-like enzyme
MYSYNNIAVAASALMIVKVIKDAKITNIKSKAIVVASSLSFGIYLIHPIFIDALNVLHIDTNTYNAYYFIPLSAALIFLISAICVYIASRLPWLNKVV